jgi:two-component system phosphate regulon sensor histidine kinase PhoR
MTRGLRAKLFLTSIAVIVLIGMPAALYIRGELTATIEERARDDLRQLARGARVAFLALPGLDEVSADQVAERLARDAAIEVDVIGFDRRMIASSSEVGVSGDILDRPEVHDAIDQGWGYAQRARRAFYAVRLVAPGDVGAIVRVSRPIDELDAAYDRLYTLGAFAAALGLIVALGMTVLASRLFTNELGRLVDHARAIAGGGSRRIPVETTDEIGALGGSLNELAEGLDRTVEELARERTLLESVLDSISQGVVALDRDRRITAMNDAARRILELETAPIGAAFIDHVRIPAVLALLPPSETSTAEVQTARGVRVLARVAAMPGGDGAILMLEDVSAMRRLETIRRDFVANVSHELRTPVSIIRANAETLIGGAKDDPVFSGKLVDGLHRNAERLALILADLLDLSRLDAGQYRIELAAVDARGAAEQAVAALEQKAAARRIALTLAASAGLTLRGDAKALDQVLVNLVDNAIKYTPDGGHVWVEATARGDRVRFEVRDDGPGIAPRHRDRIFERFYRVDPGRSREMGGTGLGLSIVKHLVESMGGAVGVDGNQPRGSTFWIELPRAA